MPHFKGDCTCVGKLKAGTPCTKKAYYLQSGAPRCGRHSDKGLRRPLPVDPAKTRAKEAAILAHKASIERAASANAASGRLGRVRLHKLAGAFAVKVPQVDGFLSVLPNHKNRTGTVRPDGALNMSSLSPKTIGPIRHGQPGLPDALNLENFHQGSKRFAAQTAEEARATQVEMFLDPVPHRHHPFATRAGPGVNRNVPEHFVWVDRDSTVHHLTYVESRQFYCTFMERAIDRLPDFTRLQDLRRRGHNLLLCGFDANPIAGSVEEAYLDASKPFGHEHVIYCMLTEEDPAVWPWRTHVRFEF